MTIKKRLLLELPFSVPDYNKTNGNISLETSLTSSRGKGDLRGTFQSNNRPLGIWKVSFKRMTVDFFSFNSEKESINNWKEDFDQNANVNIFLNFHKSDTFRGKCRLGAHLYML